MAGDPSKMDQSLPQAKLFRNDGSYNFKQREDWDYKHGYNFMAGWLGEDEVREAKKKKRKMGTVDMEAPPLPMDIALVQQIEKTALHVHKAAEPDVFERLVEERNRGKPGWTFLTEGGEGYDYYKFARHCAERKVEPRPLAEQAKKVKEDREKKQTNAKSGAIQMGSGAPGERVIKDAVFKPDELVEVLGVKSKPDYNGKIVKVMRYHSDVDRYEVKFEGGRYNGVVVKLKEENLMYSAVTERQMKDDAEEIPEGELPNGTQVEIHGLQSETARWMNGQKAVIVQWDVDAERYEVRLEKGHAIKKVKAANLKPQVPEGWEEHFDEHLGRHYYINTKSQKVTWKHPSVANQRGKMGKVQEKTTEDIEEAAQTTGVDNERKHYEVDEEEEGEGQFNLEALVAKVEKQEEKREAAEEAGEDAAELDSDDGMHTIGKKRKKKKREKISVEMLQQRVTHLIEATMANPANRATIKKDFSLLEGNFIATHELDPILVKIQKAIDAGDEIPRDLLKAVMEVMLSGLEKACQLLGQLKHAKLQLMEISKVLDSLVSTTEPKQVFDDAKWVASFLKTM
mmetsp:Transcript_31401/g.71698  ORF Transcript_31401/g.71698 Transcript_31401/m.71698 type:complete len:569 (+) Transcript_31401:340-2046(+)